MPGRVPAFDGGWGPEAATASCAAARGTTTVTTAAPGTGTTTSEDTLRVQALNEGEWGSRLSLDVAVDPEEVPEPWLKRWQDGRVDSNWTFPRPLYRAVGRNRLALAG